ncbi:MAG TPA: endonuclease/exonuclease/phosphatase family protein [Gemmatimonadales bacterium]
MQFVSINIWDLPVRIPGLSRSHRRRDIIAQLPMLKADIVLIQEAFRLDFRRRLAGAFPGSHSAPLRHVARRSWMLEMDETGGLLTIARWPITSMTFVPSPLHPGMRLDERIGRKGCLWTDIATPWGELRIGNVHLYAGNAPRDARVRRAQIRRLVRRANTRRGPTVMAGDFNMAREFEQPDRGPNGFEVLHAERFDEIGGGRTGDLATMSPRRNRFAARIQRARHDRRLTQAFFRGDEIALGPEPARLCLTDPPVSDHFGLAFSLVFG